MCRLLKGDFSMKKHILPAVCPGVSITLNCKSPTFKHHRKENLYMEKYIISLDSDDMLRKDALEIIENTITTWNAEQLYKFLNFCCKP